MEVINPRAALLSNFEVLGLLKELEADHLARAKTAQRIKKEEEAAGAVPTHNSTDQQTCEHLRTIQVEAIQYLDAPYHPTARQTPQGITTLLKGLAPYGLTKAEKLQMANLAPTTAVELYTVVEELEDRLTEAQINEVLELVQSSLTSTSGPVITNGQPPPGEAEELMLPDADAEGEDAWGDADADGQWDQDANAVDFDDVGEGAGVEGDLDMEED
ncbi:hypothetical protein PUNSTDRAFT_124232 [Punctularia strigosozonata HHB-11173 SS5]|uniref:uncharacterized protein n=1 Tax=Punctularia strigosozonata (strain HHB-11173) TaxID=741275 RepID=UPI0004417F4F|nr:uncharacterized protein PUNSTDRAFT_124232 [Punctularia strigosozonata HHB-11173 SS5]EIN12316.1 hypothetical protein PUNSTDRAFT_124232 [Punctularia strigosozonata HHB-11173 SS5]